jgi:hypothetical protein
LSSAEARESAIEGISAKKAICLNAHPGQAKPASSWKEAKNLIGWQFVPMK